MAALRRDKTQQQMKEFGKHRKSEDSRLGKPFLSKVATM
jgi:hypothetical protein